MLNPSHIPNALEFEPFTTTYFINIYVEKPRNSIGIYKEGHAMIYSMVFYQ